MARNAKQRSITLSDEDAEKLHRMGKRLLEDGEQLSYNISGIIRWVANNWEDNLVTKDGKRDEVIELIDLLDRRVRKIEAKINE